MIPYKESISDILKASNVSLENGLSSKEAKDLLLKNGENKLKEKKKKTMLQRFFAQFKDVMILILILAAAISFGIAIYEGHAKEFFEPSLILLIVILNAIIGVIQESKAEKALDALKSLSATYARVIRDGKETRMDSSLLVVGDIIKVEAGDFVPADCRLIESTSLKVEESALTGESVPSEKDSNAIVKEDAPLGDRINMIYSGCSVAYGTAKAVITETGMNTEMGKIAGLLNSESDSQTPLQKKLAQLGKYLGILALVACAIVFVVGLVDGIPFMNIFMTSISLAVSAIPEGLPAIVTIVLSIGVQRMVKKNAIVRRLPSVETLGSASIICSDKTGTLTQNRMTVVKTYVDGEESERDIDNISDSDKTLQLLKLGTLCCDGSVIVGDDGCEEHIGDPTETSIVYATLKNGFSKESLEAENKRLGGIPFDSERKLMSTINQIGDKKFVIVKGAFDELAKRCTSGNLDNAKRITDALSQKALRIIAVAVKVIDDIPHNPKSEELEKDLQFIGLVGMIDPPREEAKDAVEECRKAGIKPIMITGDHIITASAIAKQLGILEDGDEAIMGSELDEMTDEELYKRIKGISVYARVSPENKIRIVKAWQHLGQVVSMTGDGVNDAPALKAADIGCAMGITGTDVAKSAADITLTDDNFATIVHAVKEGRGIYANIKKVVGFLLGTNIGEVIFVFIAMLLWKVTPLLSMQLLWINLVTDSFPAIALGMEKVEDDVMEQKPKPKNEGIFANGFGVRIVLQGVMFGLLSLAAFYIGRKITGSLEGGRTLGFMVLSMSQIIQSFNMRSEHSMFKIGPFTNKKLNLAALVSLVLVLLVLFTPINTIFGLVYLPVKLYLIALGLIIIPTVIMEVSKAFGLIKHDSLKNK